MKKLAVISEAPDRKIKAVTTSNKAIDIKLNCLDDFTEQVILATIQYKKIENDYMIIITHRVNGVWETTEIEL